MCSRVSLPESLETLLKSEMEHCIEQANLDFLRAVNGKDGSAAWNIMDDLMDTLKSAYTKAYDSVMRKMMEL